MLRVVLMGAGPVGCRAALLVAERSDLRLVGVVDTDARKVGSDVGVLGGGRPLGVTVSPSLPARADVALVATVSSLAGAAPTLLACAEAGLHAVSTCEELSFPWRTQPRLARRVDRAFQQAGRTCLGVGVNPGFLMDYLPAVLTSVCRRVSRITVRRIQDASPRRIPFQRKIGVGLSLAAFRRRVAEGNLRHVGLPESCHMLAEALGWRLDDVRETLRPVVARASETSGFVEVPPGRVRGVEQVARGLVDGKERIRLHFRAAVGEPKPEDAVEIQGEPKFTSRIQGGVHGDVATAAVAINAVSSVARAEPGLRTMLEIPVPASRGLR